MNVLEQAARAALQGERVLLFTRLPDGLCAARIGDAWVGRAPCFECAQTRVNGQRLPTTVETPDGCIAVEAFCAMPSALLVGGGHVASALCASLARVGFRVRVADPRGSLLTKERFPGAEELIPNGYVEAARGAAPDGSDFFILTPGHDTDLCALREALRRPHGYVGMLASRRKADVVRETLLAEGFSEAALREVHAPVGLPIGAVTPEEIAVSIAAEAIAWHRVKQGLGETQPLSLLTHLARGEGGVLLSVAERRGSAPRGIGARLLLTDSGQAIGTVGGGAVEHSALEAAELTRADGAPRVVHIATGRGEMGCGGEVSVLVQRL